MKPLLFILVLLTSLSAYSKTCVCVTNTVSVPQSESSIELCKEAVSRAWWEDYKALDCGNSGYSSCDYIDEERDRRNRSCEEPYTADRADLVLIAEGVQLKLETFGSRDLCNAARKGSYKEDCE